MLEAIAKAPRRRGSTNSDSRTTFLRDKPQICIISEVLDDSLDQYAHDSCHPVSSICDETLNDLEKIDDCYSALSRFRKRSIVILYVLFLLFGFCFRCANSLSFFLHPPQDIFLFLELTKLHYKSTS